ncbi:cytochrome P450 [Stachybotrys elegans]|uniref:Cytochrome P450 n=1 Tax=Stachybotrys elegans TaxID=80388 RepID=A0A8K0WUV1_9HYPO|nr:cytochrome P450 [Stachybotrys elegans]
MDSHSSIVSIAPFLLPAIVTCFLFFARHAPASGDKHQRTPPTLPFALPLVGHLLQFLWNTERLLGKAATCFDPTTPVRLKLLNRRVTILNGASNVATLFKGSRGLSSERWLVQVLVTAFGVNTADVPFYHADNTGIGQQPLPGSNQVPREHRIFHLVYQNVHDGLSGARLEEMQNQMIRNLYAQFAALDVNSNAWTDIPDIYGSFIRNICFAASTTSLCGPRIFEAAPNITADFWDFDGHLPNLFKEMPQWLFPSAYKARDKMKDNLKRWHELAHQGYDVSQSDQDRRNWEEHFGSKLMRCRHAFFSKMPLSKDSVAADDLGLLWAATANAIPAIGWMVLEVLQRPKLLEQVRVEITPHFRSTAGTGPPSIDIDGLCQEPLIQSIYAEVLRVHNGTVVARVPQTTNFSIAGWRFPKDEAIMVSTYDTARSPYIWNQGTPENPHPVDEFWPERFILDPNDPSSGPVAPQANCEERPLDPSNAPPQPRFSLDGTLGSWVPYGGGTRMCPGRHFAKKELIVSMAMFLTEFDIQLMPRDGWIQDDKRYFMFGVMHPMGSIPARIRRRKHSFTE